MSFWFLKGEFCVVFTGILDFYGFQRLVLDLEKWFLRTFGLGWFFKDFGLGRFFLDNWT